MEGSGGVFLSSLIMYFVSDDGVADDDDNDYDTVSDDDDEDDNDNDNDDESLVLFPLNMIP